MLLSVRPSRTQRIILEPKGLACTNLEGRLPALDATRIPVSRSNGQRSGLEAGGGIPCRPNPAATLLVFIASLITLCSKPRQTSLLQVTNVTNFRLVVCAPLNFATGSTNIRSDFRNLDTPTNTLSDLLKVKRLRAVDALVQSASFMTQPAHRHDDSRNLAA